MLRVGVGDLPGTFPYSASTCICKEPVLMNHVVPANSVFLIVQMFSRGVWVCAASYVRFNLDPNDQVCDGGNYAVLLKYCTSQHSHPRTCIRSVC